MAQFGWAYVDCSTISGNCKGPDGAVQVHHGGVNGNPTGSVALVFNTSSSPYYLDISGGLKVTAFNADPSAPSSLKEGGWLYAKADGNLYWRTSAEIVDLTMDTGSSGGPSGSIQFRKGETNTFTGSAALVYDETPSVTTLYSTAVISASSTLHNVGAVTMGSTLAISGNLDTAGDMTAATISMTGFTVDADGDTNLKSLSVDNGSTIGCDGDTDMLTFNGNAAIPSLDVASNVVLKTGQISGSGALHMVGATTFGSTVEISGNIDSVKGVSGSGTSMFAAGCFYGVGTAMNISGTSKIAGPIDLINTNLNQIKFPDNMDDALSFRQGTNVYLEFDTTNNVEQLRIGAEGANFLDAVTGYPGLSSSTTFHNARAATFGSTIAASGNIDTAGDMTAGTITMTGFSVDSDGDTSAKSLKVDNGSTIGCPADTDMLTFNGNAAPASLDVANNIWFKTGLISGSSTISSVGSISSSSDLAVSGAVHATTYYGDGSSLSGISAGSVSGSSRVYSSTGIDSSGYLNVSGAAFLSGGVTHNHVMKNSGSLAHPPSATSNYTILTTDHYIGLDTTAGAITVTLPALSAVTTGKTYIIKDEGGNAGVNNITVEGNGSEKIDNQINQTINSPYASLSLYCGGARGWFIF